MRDLVYPMHPEPGEDLADFRLRQKQTAQKMAVVARQRQALFREAIRSGDIDDLALVRGDLNEFDHMIEKWTVDKMVKMCRSIGPARHAQIIQHFRVSPAMKMKYLTYVQRKELARLIDVSRDPIGAFLKEQDDV